MELIESLNEGFYMTGKNGNLIESALMKTGQFY